MSFAGKGHVPTLCPSLSQPHCSQLALVTCFFHGRIPLSLVEGENAASEVTALAAPCCY